MTSGKYSTGLLCNWQLTMTCREFASQVKGLAMSKFPSITAAGPEKARRRLIQAFRECAEDGSFATKEGNEIVRQISGVARKHNRGAEYLTHYFFAFFSAFVLNTVPTSFWVIGHIVENQDLRTRIQGEVAEVVQSTNEPDVDHPKLTVNPAAIREKCPLLVSTFNEVLRYVGSSISTSVVRDDVYIDDDRYLLTKGAWVQVSATAVHADPEIWGSDAARFNPERFLKPFKVHPSANRTFGGGSTLCPGRHLAADEILALTAMALHTFDVRFEADTQLPRRDEANLLPIMKPTADVRLELARRQGMEHVLWEYPK
jgi:cytochrome P450